ncbi:hypothetical protein, partial [Paralimibaculum aggregatum]|uniref:hypothetical protein n=1 Tax=Paralimibaculum aggregatum TaxID=3036245 RepID=UPI0025554D9F
RALEIGGTSCSSVNAILGNSLHRHRPETPAEGPAITHQNICGPECFHRGGIAQRWARSVKMLHHPTHDRPGALKPGGMADAFAE